MSPEAFVELLGRARASAILRTPLEAAAAPAMRAAIRGGFRVVEFTLNTPGALQRIEEFAAEPGVVVGAGTVLDPAQAEQAVGCGASFLVSPVVDPRVIEAAARLEVAMIPGCRTPSEMLQAQRLGAPLQKLFPAPADGPGYVRACLGPLPFLRIVPTSGVTADNARAFLDAGAHAVGFVGPLFAPADLESGAWDRIERRARSLLESLGPA